MNNISANQSTSPPFYARLHLAAAEGMDAGQYSEAIATLTSVAMLNSGFIGFETDQDANGNSIRIAYFKDHNNLQNWLVDAAPLFPNAVCLDDIVCGTGCLWPWLGDEEEEQKRYVSGVY
jgi:hypothetical protein